MHELSVAMEICRLAAEKLEPANLGFCLDALLAEPPFAGARAGEMLGLAPLYVANEGAIVPTTSTEVALAALRSYPLGTEAAVIGRVVAAHPGLVSLQTAIGGSRIVGVLPGDHLPRIC